MFKKVLIANRGEIAIRVMRACREMDITSVAVFSEADKDALFARFADESYLIGAAAATQSYLNIAGVIQKARESGADAIHPGYGFLAENPAFASACEKEGIKFIGPSSRVLALMGDKVAARREMAKAGVPVVPGTNECIREFDHAKRIATEIGYPIIIKPSGGGGGIGMTIVENEWGLAKALESTQAIAQTTFGLDDVYLEKYLSNPRHIEFQILGDSKGSVIHLGERECSIQRRHQKLIEESPSTALTPELRAKMGEVAASAARWVGYKGAGTVEFLFSEGAFYFLEVNARVQNRSGSHRGFPSVPGRKTSQFTAALSNAESTRRIPGTALHRRRVKSWAIVSREERAFEWTAAFTDPASYHPTMIP